LGGFECRLRGNDVRLRGDAGVVLVPGDLQRALIALHGIVQNPTEFVRGAELDIIRRQQRLFGEASLREGSGVGLGGGDVALDLPAYAAPDVDFPGSVGFQAILRAGATAAAEPSDVGSVAAAAAAGRPGHRGADAERGIEGGARLIDQRLGVAESRFVGRKRLVANFHLALEPIQQRVVKDHPPGPAWRRVRRGGQLPAGHFLEHRRHRRLWPVIVGPHHAAAEPAGHGQAEA
jgi:hypothetical protein